jgi:cell division initiation protein
MAGEKRFRTKFMGGFKKSDVNVYIEKMLAEFDEKMEKKDLEIASLTNELRRERIKNEEILKKADEINEDRNKIANVLIRAQEKAELIMEEAREQAVEEKKNLDAMVEQEKEKLVDAKAELRALKGNVIETLKKFDEELENLIEG